MDVLIFALVIGFFVVLCAVVGPVGGEGQIDLVQRGSYPPVPLHHA